MLGVFSVVMLGVASLVIFLIHLAIDRTAISAYGAQSVQDADSLSRLIVAEIKLELTSLSAHATNVPEFGLETNFEPLERYLTNLKRSLPKYKWIGFVDIQGQIRAASDGWFVGQSVAPREWFKQGMLGPFVTDVHSSPALAKLIAPESWNNLHFLDLAMPVRNAQGKTLGVLAAEISIDWFAERFSFYISDRLSQRDFLPVIIGEDGRLRFGAALPQTTADVVMKMANDRGWLIDSNEDGVAVLISYARHRAVKETVDMGWTTVIQTPIAALEGETQSTRSVAIAAVLVISIVAWLSFWWLLLFFSEPIRALMGRIRSARTHHRLIPDVNQLPAEFREMTRAINELITSLQERQQTLESTLEDLRDSFTGVARNFPGVLFQAELRNDKHLIFTYLSESVERYFGVTPVSMPLPIQRLGAKIDPSDWKTLESNLQVQIHSKDTVDFIFPISGNTLEKRQLRLIAARSLRNKSKTAWDGVVVDVTDLIEARRLAASADLAKSRFLAAMSHEIRTPLNGLLGYAQILKAEIKDPKHKDDAENIIETAGMLAAILNDVLDFSKIEEGKIRIDKHAFSLLDLVNSCAALFECSARERNFTFIVNTEFSPSLKLLGDSVRLRQILINLLANAIKFTEQGSVRLNVRAVAMSAFAANLEIAVTDTGIGLDASQISRLFRPFEQADESVYRRFGGSGLGLAIAKALLDAMGGTIDVTSKKGRGSSFQVKVALPIFADEIARPTERRVGPTASLYILVVDDVSLNRELLRRMLQHHGHQIVEARDGESALRAAEAEKFDLILMDIDMPGIDGMEATRLLRARAGPNQFTRIVALTGYAFESDINNALASGMDAHLAKPVTLQGLLNILEPS